MFSQQTLFTYIQRATDYAKRLGHKILLIEHLLYVFLQDECNKKYVIAAREDRTLIMKFRKQFNIDYTEYQE